MSSMKQSIAIVGGGAAAMSCAAFLDSDRYEITIYEKNKSLGRKFLVAGKGGFNLTHAESVDDMILRYSPMGCLDEALRSFDNDRLRTWLGDIGIPTFVGSSNRVYPERGIKPIAVLNAITDHLDKRGVNIMYDQDWNGWVDDRQLKFVGDQSVYADIVIFALGGGSWKVTGSDGKWFEIFAHSDHLVEPFAPANCAVLIDWPQSIIDHHEGKPIKNVAVSCGGKTLLGDMIISKEGIEGSPIYGLSEELSAELEDPEYASIFLDLKPDLSLDDITERLSASDSRMTGRLTKKLNLNRLSIALLKAYTDQNTFMDASKTAAAIKRLPISITRLEELDKAISTRGGLSIDAVDSNFKLRNTASTYAIGEMLAWNAPTGGYLLQACFSMGYHLAVHLNHQT